MTDLERKIIEYATEYYTGKSTISDEMFDELVNKLKSENPDSEILNQTGWGYDPKNFKYGTKIDHKYQEAGSIKRKPRSIDAIPDDFKSAPLVRLSAKMDGLSVVIYVKNGLVYLALTRGNGVTGIDVTNKIHKILQNDEKYSTNGIPSNFTGAIRGEVVMSNDNWNKFSEINSDYEDSRNVASGIMNRNSVSDDLQYLSFVPYKITAWEGNDGFFDLRGITTMIDKWFSNSIQYDFVNPSCLTQEFLENKFKEYNETYPSDGVVITKNTLATDKNSLIYDEVAYKFIGDVAEVTVQGVEWNLTRTGMMKPVIIYEPVELSGAVCTRATGFNATFIRDNKIGKGAVLRIVRSGEVIPHILEVIEEADDCLDSIPVNCPKCGSKLEFSGADLFCVNKECFGAGRSELHHWTNVVATVDGLGGKIKEDFFNEFNINSVEDLYSNEQWRVIDKGDDTSITNKKLVEMMDKALNQKVNVQQALVALSIPRLGWKSAEKLEESNLFVDLATYPLMDDMNKELCKDRIRSSVGVATMESIVSNEFKLGRLNFFKGRVVSTNKETDKNKESKGFVVITGKLEFGTRKEFEKVIIDAGYELAGAVNKDVKYLITNTPDSGSSKNRKADELGVEKITEKEFMELIKNESQA